MQVLIYQRKKELNMAVLEDRTKRAITYGFLAQVKSTKVFQNSILDLFVPLVKKGMSRVLVERVLMK